MCTRLELVHWFVLFVVLHFLFGFDEVMDVLNSRAVELSVFMNSVISNASFH